VIALDGTQWDSGAAPQAASPAIGLGWMRIVSVRATVLDLAHRRVSGSVSAYAKGERAMGVGLVYVVPIPFFFTNIPEAAEACSRLGRELARFVTQ